ncbi:MAG: hypothetical protein ACOCVH_00365 [Verrucomicrobiota bacterium]
MSIFKEKDKRSDFIINPYVTSDRCVDTRSVQSIADSLSKPGMNARDKAIEVYNYIRRTMFHYRFLSKEAGGGGGAADLINRVGYCLCTPTAGAQSHILQSMGVNARILGTTGHGSFVAEWDNRWHWMDAFLGLAAWNEGFDDLATPEQLKADPGLLERENPSPAPLLPCGDVLYSDILRFEPGNTEYEEKCGRTDVEWVERCELSERRNYIWDNHFKPDIILRPGESYTRNWDHEPGMYFLTGVDSKFAPPHHFCGEQAERRDSVNWPYWRPYMKSIESFDPKTGEKQTVRTGRYWANGRLTWKPSLSVLEQFSETENVQLIGDRLVPVDSDLPMKLTWRTDLPYFCQGGSLEVAGQGEMSVSIDTLDRQGKLLAGMRNECKTRFDLRPAFLEDLGTTGYRLCLELQGACACIESLEQTTVFQHNMYALPQLMPGRNEIKVDLTNPEVLKTNGFYVEFEWEGKDGGIRGKREKVESSPQIFSVEIDRATEDLPRMRKLTLENTE